MALSMALGLALRNFHTALLDMRVKRLHPELGARTGGRPRLPVGPASASATSEPLVSLSLLAPVAVAAGPEVLVGALLDGRQASARLGGRQARAVRRARQPRLVVRHLAALPRAQHGVALGLHLRTNSGFSIPVSYVPRRPVLNQHNISHDSYP